MSEPRVRMRCRRSVVFLLWRAFGLASAKQEAMFMLRAMTARVLNPQAAPDAIPLTLNKGDPVQVRQAHPERSGYVWAEDGQISAGWVPLDVLDLNSGVPRARSAYCSAELNVVAGDTVRLMWEDTV